MGTVPWKQNMLQQQSCWQKQTTTTGSFQIEFLSGSKIICFVPLNPTKKRRHRHNSVSLNGLNSICSTSQEKPHETAGSIRTNGYQCYQCNPMTNYSALSFLTRSRPGFLPACWTIAPPRQPTPQCICVYISERSEANFPKLWQFGWGEIHSFS